MQENKEKILWQSNAEHNKTIYTKHENAEENRCLNRKFVCCFKCGTE